MYLFLTSIIQFILYYFLFKYKKWPITKLPNSSIEEAVKKDICYSSLGVVFGSIIVLNAYIINIIDIKLLIILISLITFGFIDDKINFNIYFKIFFYSFVSVLIGLYFNKLSFFSKILINENIITLLIIILCFYFINAYNFLDGLDGYLALNYLFFILLYFIILFNVNGSINIQSLLSLTLPVMIFLYFNLKKICMMGDSGSIVLGCFVFLLNINILIHQYYIEFLIINIYLFSDVSITLCMRIWNKKKITSRLFDYFFLKPVLKNNKTHDFVFKIFFIYNITIFASLLTSLYASKIIGLALSIIATIIYLLFLSGKILKHNK